MQVISSKVPTLDGFNRRKNVDIRNLEQKINMLHSMVNVEKPSVPYKAKLTTDDVECLIRLFKTLDYTDLTEDKFYNEVKGSAHVQTFGKWFKMLQVFNYSQIVGFKQYEYPRHSMAASMPMIAAREKSNIPFSKWKEEIPVNYLFNKSLSGALLQLPPYEDYKSIKFSEELLLAAKPRGDLQTFNLRRVVPQFEGEDEDGAVYLWEGFNDWPFIVRHMKLQTWIFHPKFRSEDMLLDPYDWDNIPPSNHGDIVAPKPKKPSGSILDDLLI